MIPESHVEGIRPLVGNSSLLANRARWLASVLFLVSLSVGAAVDVASRATSGTGTGSEPWRGWDTTTVWIADTEYYFKGGVYAYSVSPNFSRSGIALRGEAGTVLRFEGSGPAVVFDDPVSWTKGIRMEDFTIQGNPTATNGLFLRGIWSGTFKRITVRDVLNAGIWTEALVVNVFENIVVWHPPGAITRPLYGIVLGSRGADSTTTTTIISPNIGHTTSIGIWIKAGVYGNTILNGTSESNLGKGMVIDGPQNVVISTDFEANGGNGLPNVDVEINGGNNELIGVFSSHLIDVRAGAMNKLRGRFHDVKIAHDCDFTDVSGSYLTGTLSDSSPNTIKFGYQTSEGLIPGMNPLRRGGLR